MIESPALQLHRLLDAFRSEGLDFSFSWSEALSRIRVEPGTADTWLDLFAETEGAWREVFECPDFDEIAPVVGRALDKIALDRAFTEAWLGP